MKFSVDSRMPLVATGIVAPAVAWAEAPDGSRKRAGQAKSDGGQLIWEVEITREDERWGAPVTLVERVTVPAVEQPVLLKGSPLSFIGLIVTVNPGKSGGLSVRWQADQLEAAAVPGNRRNASD